MVKRRLLVACEYSGRVRDAFVARGWDATSCDLLPSDSLGKHYQGDVLDILDDGWDMLIGHPDCTYLCRAGQRWLHSPDDYRPGKLKGEPRWVATVQAVDFFMRLRNADIPFIALENPRPGEHVVCRIGKPDQVIQPWEHGHPEVKATGLWLKGLPLITPTNDVSAYMATLPKKDRSRVHFMSPGPDRWKERSRTLTGVAEALASQWSDV